MFVLPNVYQVRGWSPMELASPLSFSHYCIHGHCSSRDPIRVTSFWEETVPVPALSVLLWWSEPTAWRQVYLVCTSGSQFITQELKQEPKQEAWRKIFYWLTQAGFFIQPRPTSSEMVPPIVSWFLPQQEDPSQTWAQTKLIETVLLSKFPFLKWCQVDTKTDCRGLQWEFLKDLWVKGYTEQKGFQP